MKASSKGMSQERSKFRFDLLLSPGFLLGLAILLLNDHVLKGLFYNWLTGKLSDFSGVPIFALFWTALLPRFRLPVFVGTALFYTYWRSPYSQPLIDAWNSQGILPVGRYQDYSDLISLAMLPLAYVYVDRARPLFKAHLSYFAVAAVSLFAFVATSQAVPRYEYDQDYHFPVTNAELVPLMNRLDVGGRRLYVIAASGYNEYYVYFPYLPCSSDPNSEPKAQVGLFEEGATTRMRLIAIFTCYKETGGDEMQRANDARLAFEQSVVQKVNEAINQSLHRPTPASSQ